MDPRTRDLRARRRARTIAAGPSTPRWALERFPADLAARPARWRRCPRGRVPGSSPARPSDGQRQERDDRADHVWRGVADRLGEGAAGRRPGHGADRPGGVHEAEGERLGHPVRLSPIGDERDPGGVDPARGECGDRDEERRTAARPPTGPRIRPRRPRPGRARFGSGRGGRVGRRARRSREARTTSTSPAHDEGCGDGDGSPAGCRRARAVRARRRPRRKGGHERQPDGREEAASRKARRKAFGCCTSKSVEGATPRRARRARGATATADERRPRPRSPRRRHRSPARR